MHARPIPTRACSIRARCTASCAQPSFPTTLPAAARRSVDGGAARTLPPVMPSPLLLPCSPSSPALISPLLLRLPPPNILPVPAPLALRCPTTPSTTPARARLARPCPPQPLLPGPLPPLLQRCPPKVLPSPPGLPDCRRRRIPAVARPPIPCSAADAETPHTAIPCHWSSPPPLRMRPNPPPQRPTSLFSPVVTPPTSCSGTWVACSSTWSLCHPLAAGTGCLEHSFGRPAAEDRVLTCVVYVPQP